MSYQTIKDGIAARLLGLGLAESKETFNYEDASTKEYGNTFILYLDEAVRNEENATLSDRYRDNQTWVLKVAFERSDKNDIIELDKLGRKREEIIKDIDNSVNWKSFALQLEYQSSQTEQLKDYFELTINLFVTDQVTY